MKNPFEDIDQHALEPARQPPHLSLWLVGIAILLPTCFGLFMASSSPAPKKIRDHGKIAKLGAPAKSNPANSPNLGTSIPQIASHTRSGKQDPESSFGGPDARSRTPGSAASAATIDSSTTATTRPRSPNVTPKPNVQPAPSSKPLTIDDFFGPPIEGGPDLFGRPDFATAPGSRTERPVRPQLSPVSPRENPVTSPPSRVPDTSTEKPEPDEPDNVVPEEPDDGANDIVATIRKVRAQVEADLNKKYPLYEPQDVVTVRTIRRQVHTGKIGYLGDDYLILIHRNNRERILFNQLEGAFRIRCDKRFRDDQIMAETRKRMIE